MIFKIIGMAAAMLTTASFIPQAIKTIKTKDTSGISFIMYLMFTLGVFFWIIYGLYIKDTAIIVANIVTFIFAAIILKYKMDNMRKGK
ncbi:MAG: SemiSWEET transporter [Bacillota bacterium]|nr:SemiSWEET transporter [Bacillota bacterium]